MSLDEAKDASIPSPAIIVRPSRETDIPAMVAIYQHHIRHGVDPSMQYEVEPLDAEDIKRRRKNMQKHRLPHLVLPP